MKLSPFKVVRSIKQSSKFGLYAKLRYLRIYIPQNQIQHPHHFQLSR